MFPAAMTSFYHLACVVILGVTMALSCATSPRPHIIFIVPDDLGWNDVGWVNPEIKTPNLDSLAAQGVILNQSYVHPICTPSRAAFLSGFYPFKTGMQNAVIRAQEPACLPLNLTILPQAMKNLGYATHMIGKWHLGFCKKECTPTYRGFDSFFGFYNGEGDHFAHTYEDYLDLRNNESVATGYDGQYSSTVFAARAQELVMNHDPDTPFFLYLALQAPREPLQAPQIYQDMNADVVGEERRIYSAMMTALDDAVGNLTQTLKDRGMFDNTLIFFTSDNGGSVTAGANNYPMRGGKITIWEGGTRAAAFVFGAGLQKTGYVHDGMMHAVDYYPTIVSAAGGNASELMDGMDGINMWEALSTGADSKRTEFVYNLDQTFPENKGHVTVRMGDYKLFRGFTGYYNGWYPLPSSGQPTEYITENPLRINGYPVRLYNVKDDPDERHDLARELPDVLQTLQDRADFYYSQAIPPDAPPADPAGSPTNFNDVWSYGWC